MEKLLARLERRLGRYAIEQLPALIVGGMILVFVLGKLRPEFLDALTLDLAAVRRGQIWRLVTFLFLPRSSSPIWFGLTVYVTWLVGTALETAWGAFKLNTYYVLGMLGTTLAAWLSGASVGNTYLNTSMFLAFATVFPDYEMLVFFVLPVRMKWLGAIAGGFLVLSAALAPWPERAAIAAALSNYLLFFGGNLVGVLRARNVQVRAAARRESVPPVEGAAAVEASATDAMGARACAICGAREQDGADIRVCSCAKCGGTPRSLCLPHAREH